MPISRVTLIQTIAGLALLGLTSGAALAVEEHHQGQAGSTAGDQASPNTSAEQSLSAPNATQPGFDPMAQMMRMMQTMMGMMGQGGMGMMGAKSDAMGPGGYGMFAYGPEVCAMMGSSGQPMMGQSDMGMMGSGVSGPMGSGRSAMTMMGGSAVDYTDAWLAFIRTALKITDAQNQQWDEFANALRANAGWLREVHARTASAASTPDIIGQLEQRERWAATRLESLRAVKSTFANLHDALTDDQRKAAKTLAPLFWQML